MSSQIPLSQPDITPADIDAVVETMRSGRLSIGPAQETFEDLVARRAERSHGIAVSSGTAGLHLALLALGIGPGDEVITTPFSFIASANSILMVGATPVFVDMCPTSLNLDPSNVDAAVTDKTRAILAVEVFWQHHAHGVAGEARPQARDPADRRLLRGARWRCRLRPARRVVRPRWASSPSTPTSRSPPARAA